MDVLFLVEAGGKYGLGHLMRSTVLIDALRDRGVRSISALRMGEGGLPDWALPAAEHIALEGDDVDVSRQAEALARARRPDWTVIDGYGLLATDLIARLHALGLRIMAFDDLGTEGGGADLVINQNCQRAAATDGPAVNRLLGPRYALVDPNYARCRDRPLALAVKRVLVTFGGSDQHGLSGRVIDGLADVPGQLTIDVVVGPHHRTRSFAPPGQHRLLTHQAPRGLAALLHAADLVISAAGSTCWQVCCVGVPLIAVHTVDNQDEVTRCLFEYGGAITVERDEFCALLERGGLPELIARLNDLAVRRAMVTAQRLLIDGNGTVRVLAAMGL